MDDMQVYIANLGKYNEGELVGAWFTFPIYKCYYKNAHFWEFKNVQN